MMLLCNNIIETNVSSPCQPASQPPASQPTSHQPPSHPAASHPASQPPSHPPTPPHPCTPVTGGGECFYLQTPVLTVPWRRLAPTRLF